MIEYRRILLDGAPVLTTRHDEELVSPDGRVVARFRTNVPPEDPSVLAAIDSLLDATEAPP